MKRCLADYRIRFGHSIQACSNAEGGIRRIGEKNELVPNYSHRLVSETLQESLGILMKNRIHKEWDTQLKKEGLLASYFIFKNPRKESSSMLYEKVLCFVLE